MQAAGRVMKKNFMVLAITLNAHGVFPVSFVSYLTPEAVFISFHLMNYHYAYVYLDSLILKEVTPSWNIFYDCLQMCITNIIQDCMYNQDTK